MAYRNAAVAKAQESEEGFGEWSVTHFFLPSFACNDTFHWRFVYKVESPSNVSH